LVSWILEPCALPFYFNEKKFDAISAYLACVYGRFDFTPDKNSFYSKQARPEND
jgi:hypothetical protein